MNTASQSVAAQTVGEGAKSVLVWLLGSVVAIFSSLATSKAAWVGATSIPVGNDSFYHARRILDLVQDASSLREFDPFIHSPEGSLIIWPWGYDYLMSLLVRVGVALGISHSPMTVLAYLPVVGYPITIALMIVICRRLELSVGATLLAALATALFPLNQEIFGVGAVDHHFAEHIITLGSIAAALAWLQNPGSNLRACVLGCILGLACAIQNGIFILQFPVIATFVVWWVRGRDLPRSTLAFAISLAAATIVAASPSTGFRTGHFDFYSLSWFHVYFSACVAFACVYLQRLRFGVRNAVILVAVGAAMIAPVVSQVLLAGRFLSVSVEGAEQISEVQSVLQLAHNAGIMGAAKSYTLLFLLLPVTIVLCIWQAVRAEKLAMAFFWVSSLFGAILLATMVRFHMFGSYALFLPWIFALTKLNPPRALTPKAAHMLVAAVLVVSYASGVKAAFTQFRVAANDPYYALTQEIYPVLSKACMQDPGIALVLPDDGNYVRYHTNCSVIANNFLLTPQHERKILEVRALFQMSAADLARTRPDIRYVFVHRGSLFKRRDDGGMQFLPAGDPESPDPILVQQLLSASPDHLPPGYRMLSDLAFEQPSRTSYARLFELQAAGGAARNPTEGPPAAPQP